jgi:hypothetical protein
MTRAVFLISLAARAALHNANAQAVVSDYCGSARGGEIGASAELRRRSADRQKSPRWRVLRIISLGKERLGHLSQVLSRQSSRFASESGTTSSFPSL